jgi:hypothetical protein
MGAKPERGCWAVETAGSPEVVITTCLLGQAKLRGCEFRWAAPDEDGPLVGHRASGDQVSIIHVDHPPRRIQPRLPGRTPVDITR